MIKKYLTLFLVCFYSVSPGMEVAPSTNKPLLKSFKKLSLFEFWDDPKTPVSQHLSASSDIQSIVCSHVYNREYWHIAKRIEDAEIIHYDPIGNYCAAAYTDKSVKIFDDKIEKIMHALPIHSDRLTKLKFDPTGRYLATVCEDWSVQIFDALSGKLLCKARDGDRATGNYDPDCYGCKIDIEFDYTGDNLAILWAHSLKIVKSVSGELIRELPHSMYGIGFDPLGEYIAVSTGGGVRIIERETENPVCEFPHKYIVVSCSFSPMGKYLLTRCSTGSHDGTIRIFEMQSKKLICELFHGYNYVSSFAFDATEEHLVTHVNCNRRITRIFRIPSGQLINVIPDGQAMSVEFGLGGRCLTVNRVWSEGSHVLQPYKEWTLQQKLLLKLLNIWICVEKPHKSIQSMDQLLRDVALKCNCNLVELRNIMTTFSENMVFAIWNKMKHMIGIYGKKTQEELDRDLLMKNIHKNIYNRSANLTRSLTGTS